MDVKTAILTLVGGLKHQDFNFSENLFPEAFVEDFEYLTGTKKKFYQVVNKLFVEGIVSFKHVKKEEFEADLERFQNVVDPRMLLTWSYKSGNLVMVGIMYGDSLSEQELQGIFTRFDEGLAKNMRKYVGRNTIGATKMSTYGTMMLVFSDSAKAQRFNATIGNYFNSHFWKQVYASMMSLDSASMELTQGKGPMGLKWQGGIDVSLLKKSLLEGGLED